MADNYVQFSFTLEHLKRAEIKWIEKVLEISIDTVVNWPRTTDDSSSTSDAKELKKLLSTKANRPTGELEYWPEFVWALEGNTLHIYSREGGNELNAAVFVHAFLATFRPKEIVIFGACYSCSKMRVGEFGGQDWIITAWAKNKQAIVP